MIAPHILKGIEMGLIPVEHIVQWADQQIAAAESPELWLIDLALTRADKHDLFSLIRRHGATTEVDDDTFLALVAYGYFHSRLSLEQVRTALVCRFCWIEYREMTRLRRQIYIFDDEMDWDPRRARRTCEDILLPFRDEGDRLIGDVANDAK